MQYRVLSPDGFDIAFDVYKYGSMKKAQAALAAWCERYKAQGYYSTAGWEHIPLDELPARCSIVAG